MIKVNEQRTDLKQQIVKLENRVEDVEQQIGSKQDDSDDDKNNNQMNGYM